MCLRPPHQRRVRGGVRVEGFRGLGFKGLGTLGFRGLGFRNFNPKPYKGGALKNSAVYKDCSKHNLGVKVGLCFCQEFLHGHRGVCSVVSFPGVWDTRIWSWERLELGYVWGTAWLVCQPGTEAAKR